MIQINLAVLASVLVFLSINHVTTTAQVIVKDLILKCLENLLFCNQSHQLELYNIYYINIFLFIYYETYRNVGNFELVFFFFQRMPDMNLRAP